MSEDCIVYLDNSEEYDPLEELWYLMNVQFIFERLGCQMLMHPYAKAHCCYLARSEPECSV